MLRLFGALSIDGTGGTGLTERATRGLIAYLVLKRGRASLDELLEALWPGEAPAATRPRLWKAKRQAQRLLGDALGRRHDGYELDRRQLRFDVEEIERLRAGQPERERLEEALLTADVGVAATAAEAIAALESSGAGADRDWIVIADVDTVDAVGIADAIGRITAPPRIRLLRIGRDEQLTKPLVAGPRQCGISSSSSPK